MCIKVASKKEEQEEEEAAPGVCKGSLTPLKCCVWSAAKDRQRERGREIDGKRQTARDEATRQTQRQRLQMAVKNLANT